jgi:hypothetical protein
MCPDSCFYHRRELRYCELFLYCLSKLTVNLSLPERYTSRQIMLSKDDDETITEEGHEDLLESEDGKGRNVSWQSLEIARFIVSLLTPLLLLFVGYMINDSQRRNQQNFEQTQRENQRNFEERQRLGERLIEKRLVIFDQVGPKFNDIFCYFNYVGHWKELKPTDLIAYKRLLDKTMYTYRPLFSEKLFSAYTKFIDSAYQIRSKITEDAKLRTKITYRKEAAERAGYAWESEWEGQFTGEENPNEVNSAYKDLITNFAAELGMKP